MSTIWIVKTDFNGKVIYLPSLAGSRRDEVKQKVIENAKRENFVGTLEERLAYLQWEIVEVRLLEVTPRRENRRFVVFYMQYLHFIEADYYGFNSHADATTFLKSLFDNGDGFPMGIYDRQEKILYVSDEDPGKYVKRIKEETRKLKEELQGTFTIKTENYDPTP